jgi:hypothetical protein
LERGDTAARPRQHRSASGKMGVVAKFGQAGDLVRCSFCGKSPQQVGKLIAGPGVYICNECIALCNDIIQEEGVVSPEEGVRSTVADGAPSLEEDAVPEGRERLRGRLAQRPTLDELAAEMSLDEEKIAETLRRAAAKQPEQSAGVRTTDALHTALVPAALRMIQQELAELSRRLAEVVERTEKRDDP